MLLLPFILIKFFIISFQQTFIEVLEAFHAAHLAPLLAQRANPSVHPFDVLPTCYYLPLRSLAPQYACANLSNNGDIWNVSVLM